MKSTNNSNVSRRALLRAGAGAMVAASVRGLPSALAAAGTKKKSWDMKLTTSSVMFDTLKIEQVCERVQRIGFRAVDIWGPFTHYKTKCDHLEDIRKRLGGKGLAEMLAKYKLDVAAFTLYQKAELSQYWEMIRDYGGGVIVRSDKAARSSAKDMSANMRKFFEKLKPEIELAEKSKSVLAIENHGGGLLNSIESFKAFVELNPDPKRVGIAFAPWHLQGYKDTPMTEFIEVAGPQIQFFYGWQRGTQKDRFGIGQLPGFGPADFTPWLQKLADTGYSKYIAVFLHGHTVADEIEPKIAKSREYLLKCRKKVQPS